MKRKLLATVLSMGMMVVSSLAVFADRAHGEDDSAVGAVYTMTNAADGNKVVIFNRDEDGTLKKAGSVSTGGAGSGPNPALGGLDPLGSQHSLVLTRDGRWLLAVNAGSNEISAFRVLPDGLELVGKVDSGGKFPVSLAVFHNLVYVLNTGTPPNITGFNLSHTGRLTPLAGSTRLLISTGAFAQVGFGSQGNTLVVTDKAGNDILVYSVNEDGLPTASPVTSPSNGKTPFGFIFDRRGHLLVVEAGTNAVSSYNILTDDTLQLINGSVPNGQQAACWIAANERGDVFTANPGSGTVSAYRLMAGSGQVTLLDGAAGTGNKPLDLAVTPNGRFLYAVDPAGGGIDAFGIEENGSLTNLGPIDGQLSISAQGIAAC